MPNPSDSLSRRNFLQKTALLGTASALGLASTARAETTPAPAQRMPPLAYPFSVGKIPAWALSDGMLRIAPIAGGAVTNANAAAVDPLLERNHLPTDHLMAPLNTTLLEIDGQRVLLDCGYGERSNEDSGLQTRALQEIGVTEDSIDVVVITHIHPDHLFGYLNADGSCRFPNAEFVISEQEKSFWGNADNRLEKVGALFDNAINSFEVAGDNLRTVNPGDAITTNLEVVEAYGHTPGHIAIAIHDGSESLLVTSDAFNHPILFLEHPEWHFGFDFDPDATVVTRKALLDRAAADRQRLLAYHFPFPGIGRVSKSGVTSFEYFPEAFATV